MMIGKMFPISPERAGRDRKERRGFWNWFFYVCKKTVQINY